MPIHPAPAPDRPSARVLGLLAAISAPSFLFFLYLVPMTPGRLALPAADLISQWAWWSLWRSLPLPFLNDSNAVAGLVMVCAGAAFLANGVAVMTVWNRPPNRRTVLLVAGSILAFFALSALAPPNLNTDIYHYIARARVAAVHHQNPHSVPSNAFADDPLSPYVSSQYAGEAFVGDKLAAWTMLSVGLASVGGDGPITNLMLFRAMFLIFNLGNVALIAAILRRLDSRKMLAGVVLYAWNPISVVMGQGKTDTVMVFFFLLGAWLIVRERRPLGMLALTVSALVKLITLPLAGLYLGRELKLRRWRSFAVLAAIGIAAVVAINAPFVPGADLIGGYVRAVVREAGAPVPAPLRMLVVPIGAIVFVAALWIQDGRPGRLLWGWAMIALFLSVLVLGISSAWYHLTFLAVAALVASGPLAAVALALTLSTFLFTSWYRIFNASFAVPDLIDLPRFVVYVAPAVAVLAVALMLHWWRPAPRHVEKSAGGGGDRG